MIASIREFVSKDFALKLFSLVLAILIWFTVSFALDKESTPLVSTPLPLSQNVFSNLPVVVLSSAQDVHDFSVDPKAVEVTVQGTAATLKNLQAKDIRVLVDLTGIEAAHDLRKRLEVTTPAGVTLVKVDPVEVQVIFPRRN